MRTKGMAWLLFAVTAFAQAPADPAAQTPASTDKPASIEGTVHNALTGEPLQHVHVILRGSVNGAQRQYGAMSGPDGKFSVTSVIPGSYTVAGEHAGFVMPSVASARIQVQLRPDEKKSDVSLKMTPTGQITGRVTDADGAPLEGASVMVEGQGFGSSATDEKGQFRIGGLAPGKYRVQASGPRVMYPPEIRTDGTEDQHYASTYFPGVLTAKEATRVEVRAAGDTGGLDIQLKRVPWVKVSGRVIGKTRASDPAAIRVQQVAQGFGLPGTAVRPDGTFAIWNLDPGKYWITAGWNSPGGQYVQTAPLAIEVAGANIENLALRFVPSFELSGQLQYENEAARQMPQPPTAGRNPQQQQQAQQQQNAPKPPRTLILREATGFGQSYSSQVSEDDIFHFKAVAPGRYRLTLSWFSAYVKQMQLGPAVIDGGIIDLSSGGDAGGLSVMLAAATGSVSGVVQDGSGTVQGTRVVLAPDVPDAPSYQTRYTTAAADGTYTFGNLPPGSYKLVAVSEYDTDTVMQRGGLDFYEDLMDKVEVHQDEKVSKDLRRASGNR